MGRDPEVTLIIILTDTGINTVLYYFPYVSKSRGKINFTEQNMNDICIYLKDQCWTPRNENCNVWNENYTGKELYQRS